MSGADRHPFAQLMDSPGYAFLGRLKGLTFSVNLLRGNVANLIHVCSLIEHPEKGVTLMGAGMMAVTKAQMEANRLLHNFVAAAFTLVEHSRNFMRRHYSGTELMAAYEAKVKTDFGNDGLAQFVKGLRNYFLHNDLPDNSMNMHAAIGQPTATTIVLKRDSLLAWDGWNKTARDFLSASDVEIRFAYVAQAYWLKAATLQDWLTGELMKLHVHELEEVRRLEVEVERCMPREKVVDGQRVVDLTNFPVTITPCSDA